MSYIEESFNGIQQEIKGKFYEEIPIFYELLLKSKSYSDFISALNAELESRIDFSITDNDILSQQSALQQVSILLNNEGQKFTDPNRNDLKFKSTPFLWIWQAINSEKAYATMDFYDDMLDLLKRAFAKTQISKQTKESLLNKMHKLEKADDANIIEIRKVNKLRVIKGLIQIIESDKKPHKIYHFTDENTLEQKIETVEKWWNDYNFHLRYAIKNIEQLKLTTNNKLPKEVMANFENGVKKGIPIFINPYYLSLVHITDNGEFSKHDKTIRDYIFNSKDLVDTFGKIKAWEKEDIIEIGKPNAAGWHLPTGDSVHRRYPEVAIFIPQGRGRACAGLCVSCQRMYGFQKGSLNFDLEKMDTKIDKSQLQEDTLKYFENDSHLQDILITGGDAMMNTNARLKSILNDFYDLALRKKNKSDNQKDGEKYAIFQRVRIGTRILAYLPQRVDNELIQIFKEFKIKAAKLGIKQFVIQTHFQTTMELSQEAISTIKLLRQTGWIVINQHVFTAAASRRAHNMQLRSELNKLGILPYYTFAVKGFKENRENFTPIARVAQEVYEEKVYGKSTDDRSTEFHNNPSENHKLFAEIIKSQNLPFVATDRSIINMPAVGKSLSFEQVGITMDGRRVLSFTHDKNRNHSPVVNHDKKVIIVESKSIAAYLRQIEDMGENIDDYDGIYAYSTASTEQRAKVFEYPKYDYQQTDDYNNCEV